MKVAVVRYLSQRDTADRHERQPHGMSSTPSSRANDAKWRSLPWLLPYNAFIERRPGAGVKKSIQRQPRIATVSVKLIWYCSPSACLWPASCSNARGQCFGCHERDR